MWLWRSNKRRSNKSTFKYDGTQPVPKDVEYAETLPGVKIIADLAFEGCVKLKWFICHEGIETIGKRAFFGCQSLEEITFPSSLTEIGDYAFNDCRGLRELLLNEGLEKIGQCAFVYCRSLGGITCPSTLNEIGENAFNNCVGLREIILNEGLKEIGDGAFCACHSLEQIACPSTLTEIGDYAFGDCTVLREVVFNEGIEKIGKHAFFYCQSLREITCPSSLTEIRDEAFVGCYFLGSLKFPSIPKHFDKIVYNMDRADILTAIDETPHISMVDGEVSISGAPLEGGNDWMTCKENLDQILDLIAHVQLKEATTAFELALWKEKMTEESMVGDGNRNREACRIGVPGPFKDAVMQFFPHEELNQPAE